MELILASSTLNDIDGIDRAEYDFDIGRNNDFEIKIQRDDWRREYTFGNVIYCAEMECGGIIGEIDTNTARDTITILGRTWRGMLKKKIIRPPDGKDYKTVSGELNTVLESLVNEQFGGYFVVPKIDTGTSVANYQFDRYCTLYDGIIKMLKSVGFRIQIRYIQQERGQPGYVELMAVKITDYSESIELSQDSKLNFSFKEKKNGINHLVCVGKGELQDRKVVDLYVQEDGTIGDERHYTGIYEIEEVYENTSSESAELREKGIEKLMEKMNSTEFKMDVSQLGIDVDIGDIIGGRDYLTGMYAKKPVEGKVYKMKNGISSIDYTLEGDG